jgi:DNA-binding XRE family transcriptional regulator
MSGFLYAPFSEAAAKGLRTHICAVPFCRQTPLTLKALRAKDYSENPQTLGGHLKKRRRELGLFQREVAKRLDVAVETLINWEKDRTKPVAAQFRPVIAFLGYTTHPLSPRPWLNALRPSGGYWG